MPPADALRLQDVLDGFGHAILIFNSEGDLVVHNRAAGTIVGIDLKLLREKGWTAAEMLFKPHDPSGRKPPTLTEVRHKANVSGKPVRFQILLSGEFTPCWAAAIPAERGKMYTSITIDVSDWSALTDLIDTFRKEVKETVAATRGHLDIINNSMGVLGPDDSIGNLTKRIGGFNRLIDMQMFRTGELIELMERMEDLRTGRLRELVRQTRRRIKLSYWLEDFIEEMEHADLLDPETESHDYRSRIQVNAEPRLEVLASSVLMTRILRDMLRNAIMYSMKATPIIIHARQIGETVQIDVVDEGYGVRERERERVFAPFQRARQPQIISEFGYGLSLYLCKHEAEAMSGTLWYESEEKVGSTFSVKLPVWRDRASSSSDSNNVS